MSSSVLSRLGNPLAYHVLPSRRAAIAAQDTGMPPPPPKRMGSGAAAAAGGPSQDRREVLPTLAYEEALESIIESTFFPDLPRMTQQLAWLDALSSGDPSQIHHAREGIASSIRRSHGVVSATPQGSVIGGAGGGAAQRLAQSRPLLEDGGGSLVSWSAGLRVPPHPTLPGAPGGGGGGSVRGGSVFMQGGSVVGGASRGAPLALSSFQARFTSEDHSVFQQNMRLVNLKQRLWWVSDATAPAAPLLLGDAPRGRGLLMNKREGAIVPFSAAPSSTTTTTSSNPTESMGVLQMWKWRPRNALFFPPSLEASYDTSRISRPLALSSSYSGLELAMPTRVRDGGPPPPPPRLSATRFNSQAVKQAVEMEVEAQAKQIIKASDAQAGFNLWPGGGCGPISSTGRSYSLLPTPIIQPFSSEESSRSGSGTAQHSSSSSSSSALIQVSPIITWGDIAGTPIMLDPPPSPPPPPIPTKALDLAAAFGMSGDDLQQSGGGGGFTLPPPSSRAATHDTLLKAIGERNEGGGGRRMGGGGRGGGAPLPPHPSLPAGGTSRRTGTVLGTEGVTPIYAASAFAPGGGMGGGHHHHHHHPPPPSRSAVAGSVSGRRSAVTGVSAATSRVMHALSAMPPSARALLLRQQQAHGRGEEGGELKGVFSGGGRKRQRE